MKNQITLVIEDTWQNDIRPKMLQRRLRAIRDERPQINLLNSEIDESLNQAIVAVDVLGTIAVVSEPRNGTYAFRPRENRIGRHR